MRAFARNMFSNRHHRHHHHDEDGSGSHTESRGRMVFAHYMVGLTDGQTVDDWAKEMTLAHAASIDGFALNIGPSDPYTLPQLRHAFAAASRLSLSSLSQQQGQDQDQGRPLPFSFTLFPSFDMACGGAWTVAQVVEVISEFCASGVHFAVDGLPFVSTFEGPGWAENWEAVRRAMGGIYLVPDWSSLGPEGVGRRLGIVDGAFSWAAWPRAGEGRMTAGEDGLYRRALRGKAYMMGVSPWFYTRLPQWDKNWHSSGESLWFDRWAQILELKPEFVQIITWNDFGESSYICDPQRPSQVVSGASEYVDEYSHAAFRATLPYFIKAYKTGKHSRNLAPDEDCTIAWYRTTPAKGGPDGGTIWGQRGGQSASTGARDVVSVLAITREPTAITVRIGDSMHQLQTHHKQGHVHFFEVPVQGSTGPVVLSMHGKSSVGPDIRSDCAPRGHTVFNCAAIQV